MFEIRLHQDVLDSLKRRYEFYEYSPDKRQPPYDIGHGILMRSDEEDASFVVSEMPGCCGLLVFHSLCFSTDQLLDDVHKVWEMIARHNRVARMVYTAVTQQTELIQMLTRHDWYITEQFMNPKYNDAGNTVHVFVKSVRVP